MARMLRGAALAAGGAYVFTAWRKDRLPKRFVLEVDVAKLELAEARTPSMRERITGAISSDGSQRMTVRHASQSVRRAA